MRMKHFLLAIVLAIVPLLMVFSTLIPTDAQATIDSAPSNLTIIDDFNDGDSADWSFFGGDVAGGGGGVADDRPYEGSHYFSTGWGAGGPSGGFFGGGFRNFDNAAQVNLPANPVFSVWVYNQSDATSEGYTLEITLREDVEGDGWNGFGGTDESFRLDTTFTSADYNDQWVQITAPLADFTLADGTGDGTFNGALDEIVIVVAGVPNADNGTTVEADFDQFAFFEAPTLTIIDDFNDGDSADWSFFGGDVAGGGGGVADDRPYEGSHYFSTGWGAGGPSGGFFGGGFRNFDNNAQITPPADAAFSVWVYNQSDATSEGYTLEITLREDVEGDGWNGFGGTDESFRLDTTFTSADYNDQWVQITAPLADFTLADGTGDGTFNGALDEIVIVVAGVPNADVGTTVEVDFDQFAFLGVSSGDPVVAFEQTQVSVMEGDSATFAVTLNVTPTEAVTVSYATVNDTAVAGTHYTATSGTLVFPAGVDTQTITVETIDNTGSELDRALNIELSDPVGAVLGSRSTATLNILVDMCGIRSNVVDNFENGLATGVDGDGNNIGFFTFQDPITTTTVAFTTTLVSSVDPLALPGQSGDNTLYQVDLNVGSFAGTTHAFENIPVDTWITQDWSTYAGISFWFYGQNTGTVLGLEVKDNRTPGATTDDAEIWNYTFTDDFDGWKLFEVRFNDFSRKEIGNGAPNDGFGLEETHGWAFLALQTGGQDVTYYMDDVIVCGVAPAKPLSIGFDLADYTVDEGDEAVLTVELNRAYTDTVTVDYATGEATAQVDEQYTPASGTLTFTAGTLTQTITIPTFDNEKYTRDSRVTVNLYEGSNVELGFQRRAVLTIADTDRPDPLMIDDFEGYHPFINVTGTVTMSIDTLLEADAMARPGQAPYEDVLTVEYDGEASFSRTFSQGQDWSAYDHVSVWVYGQNSGETITYTLHDNMSATTATVDPSEWVMVWSDEFDGPAGAPPNSNVWKHELGDGALNGIVGWGNSESQYYTDSTDNSFMDGSGNLVIRMESVDTAATDLVCWYGACEYTSARLLTQDQLDFEYGRIEARVQAPDGPAGLWPAFWMLGTDIPEVGWPQTGEIDIMEYVSRIPDEIFGTIHGPGYAGGASFGNTYTFSDTVPSQGYITYAVEWTPDSIIWYVNGIQYHDAVPADVAPNEWVFNHPFFLLLNFAIGGNFGGEIAEDMTMPQETIVDYVRVYQAADTAERFEATFVDDFTGWQLVTIPFEDFVRSADQPAGAPDDGLGLTEIWGYGFSLNGSGTIHMDLVRVGPWKIYLPFIFTTE